MKENLKFLENLCIEKFKILEQFPVLDPSFKILGIYVEFSNLFVFGIYRVLESKLKNNTRPTLNMTIGLIEL